MNQEPAVCNVAGAWLRLMSLHPERLRHHIIEANGERVVGSRQVIRRALCGLREDPHKENGRKTEHFVRAFPGSLPCQACLVEAQLRERKTLTQAS